MGRRALVVLAGALSLAAGACGGGASGATPGDPAPAPTAPPVYGGRGTATTADPVTSPLLATTTTLAASRGGPVEPRGTLPVPTIPPATTPPAPAPPSQASTAAAPPAAIPSTAAPRPPDPPTAGPDAAPAVGLGAVALAVDANQVVELGRSREGRPIFAVERGTPGGVPVLVIGVIHGNEAAGAAIVQHLATAPVPAGVDLWLIETMNPDGQAAGQRGNAAGVDLNRNFPLDWGPIGSPGDSQYAGTGPASEPETQAVARFVSQVRPVLGVWYHQDLYRLSPGQGFERELKERYSVRTGLPILAITGGTYTGVAAVWQRAATDGISFIVELGSTLSRDEAEVHAAAVLDLASVMAAR